jgi:hypothetical protein
MLFGMLLDMLMEFVMPDNPPLSLSAGKRALDCRSDTPTLHRPRLIGERADARLPCMGQERGSGTRDRSARN